MSIKEDELLLFESDTNAPSNVLTYEGLQYFYNGLKKKFAPLTNDNDQTPHIIADDIREVDKYKEHIYTLILNSENTQCYFESLDDRNINGVVIQFGNEILNDLFIGKMYNIYITIKSASYFRSAILGLGSDFKFNDYTDEPTNNISGIFIDGDKLTKWLKSVLIKTKENKNDVVLSLHYCIKED